MGHCAARRRIRTKLRMALLFLCASFVASSYAADQEVEKRFRELYGNLRDYKEIKQLELNGRRYILAYWLEDNSPLQLMVHIFRYTDGLLSQPVTKVFSGGVAEGVTAVLHFDITGE